MPQSSVNDTDTTFIPGDNDNVVFNNEYWNLGVISITFTYSVCELNHSRVNQIFGESNQVVYVSETNGLRRIGRPVVKWKDRMKEYMHESC